MATIPQHTHSRVADAIALGSPRNQVRQPDNKGNQHRYTYSRDVTRASQSSAAANDANLIRRLRTNDVDAFETLVRLNCGRMLTTAWRMLGSEVDAQDAVQDALLAAYRAIGLFGGNSMLSTWLHRLVINSSLMQLRFKRRRLEKSITNLLHLEETGKWAETGIPLPSTGETVFESKQTRAMVRACIARLPEPYQAILRLRDLEELNCNEAATLLGISVNTAKIRLYRARRGLKMLIERHRSSE